MDKIIKIVATIIVVMMVATVLINASILFIGYAGFSLASVLYGAGVISMFGIVLNGYVNSEKTFTIGTIFSIVVLSMTSLIGIVWYLFETLPALGVIRDFKVITFANKE